MVAFIKVESRYMVQHSAPMPILRSSNRYQSFHFEWTTMDAIFKAYQICTKRQRVEYMQNCLKLTLPSFSLLSTFEAVNKVSLE